MGGGARVSNPGSEGSRIMKHQEAEILKLLQSRPNEWVPVYEIAKIALQYNARILELRRQGYTILNKTLEIVDGQKHTAFMLVQEKPRQAFEEKGQMAFL